MLVVFECTVVWQVCMSRDSIGQYVPHLCVTASQNTDRVPHDVCRSIPYSGAQGFQVVCVTI
jgi:hypothetical protein